MELLEQHFHAAFAAPEGVRKLRELILTLAMQGKLVPQNPNDPPASQLLKEIEAEKKRLIKEGKIRAPKPLPEIRLEEVPYSLPLGWEWVRLIEIGNWTIGSGFPPNIQGDQHQKIFMCKVSDMNLPGNEKYIESVNNTISEELAEANKINIHEPSAIIFPKIGGAIATNKRRILRRKTAIDNNCLGIKPYTKIESEWAYQLLLSFDFSLYQVGTSVPAISQGAIGEIVIGLPPLPEQHRIVAKIEQLMERCDELERLRAESEQKRRNVHTAAVTQLLNAQTSDSFANAWQFITQNFGELYTVKENVTELRKAVLQLGLMGKLVPQNPNDQPASQLLKEIESEKKRLVKEGKIKTPKPLPEIKQEEVPYALPQGWKWVRLGDISNFINGDRGKNYPNREEYVSEGVPWINTGHIESDGSLTQSEMYFITRNKFESLNSGKIAPGDLVYCLRGATFGKTAIVDPYSEGAIASSLMIIRPYRPCPSRYLYHFLVSPFGRSQIFKFDNGSAQPNLSAGNVQLYLYPLPPLSEQNRIVAKIDRFMALCDALGQQIDAATNKQAELLNSVMAQLKEFLCD
jgi:type I restriction enzyme S subunit